MTDDSWDPRSIVSFEWIERFHLTEHVGCGGTLYSTRFLGSIRPRLICARCGADVEVAREAIGISSLLIRRSYRN